MKDTLLDLRMTTCLIRLVQKEMHFPIILVGPLLFHYQKGVLAFCPQNDNNFSFFYATSVMTGRAAVPRGCSRSRKKKTKLICDIEGLLDHQPTFLQSHLLTLLSYVSPLHTSNLLSYRVAVA